MDELALSDIIESAPRFSLFDELVRMPAAPAPVSAGDLAKVHKIVDDVGLYLRETHALLGQIQGSRIEDVNRDNLAWYGAGKIQVYTLTRNLDSIGLLISRLAGAIDAPDNNKHLEFNHLLAKIDQTAEVLADVRAAVKGLKRKVDIAVSFSEINESTIGLLDKEIEDCVQVVLALQQKKLSSPQRVLPKLNLREIVARMKINTTGGFTTKSLTLPTFNDADAALYSEYMHLESRIEPLKVSVDFLPLRINEFSSTCTANSPSLFPKSVLQLDVNYQRLRHKWNYLCKALALLRHDAIDSKWSEIFSYLIGEISKVVDRLHDEFTEAQRVTKNISSDYKLCSNTITVVNKAISESILTDETVINELNHRLMPQWQALNKSIAATRKDVEHPADTGGLRSFHSTKRHSQSRQEAPSGLGIDLGIDVESSRDPFSIVKADRVVDIGSDLPKLLKPALLTELKNAKSKEDDEDTLVSHKHAPQVEELAVKLDTLRVDWSDMKNPRQGYRCRIPIIVPDYVHKGLPIVKKKYQDKPTKIPNIGFNHPVFNSPQSPYKKIPSSSLGLRSPVRLDRNFNINMSPTPKSAFGDDSDFAKPSRSPSRASSSLLRHSYRSPSNLGNAPSLGNTPNLTYQTPPSYKSTSPDRPTSSLGSRFDDEHLLQPLKLRNEKRAYYT